MLTWQPDRLGSLIICVSRTPDCKWVNSPSTVNGFDANGHAAAGLPKRTRDCLCRLSLKLRAYRDSCIGRKAQRVLKLKICAKPSPLLDNAARERKTLSQGRAVPFPRQSGLKFELTCLKFFALRIEERCGLKPPQNLVTAREKTLEHTTILPARYVVFSKGIGRVMAELETFSPNRYAEVLCN